MIGVADVLALVLIGAFCSLDTVSVGQTMVSRPIVSATLGGAALGRPSEGLIVGAVMELFALETMPFGASRYPEWGAAGVTAGASYVVGGPVPGSLAFAVLLGLAVAGLGSLSMVWHRKIVARIAGTMRDEIALGSGHAVARLHVTGIASDLVRGLAVTIVGAALVFTTSGAVLFRWAVPFGASQAWPLILATAVGLAAVMRCSQAAGGPWYLGAGFGVGTAALLVLS